MSDRVGGTDTGTRDRIVFATILIVVGVASLVLQLMDVTTDLGGWIVAVIGLGLLGAFAVTRHYGYLIPGGIMTGLGAGIVVSEAVRFADDQARGGVIVLGLGVGFLSIWVLGTLVRLAQNHWWPLVPGGILAVIGGALIAGGAATRLLDYWGVVIIAVGLFVLWRAFTEGRVRT